MVLEPVGLAVGVVPLVANIFQASQCVREIISIYKAAPDDLEEIFHQTHVIERVCKDIRAQKATSADEALIDALGSCEKNIANVYNQIGRVNSRKKGGGRKWYYVTRKSDIDKSIRKLEASLRPVELCLQAYSCSSSSISAPLLLPVPTGVVTTQFTPEPPPYTIENDLPPPPPPFEDEAPLQIKLPATSMSKSLISKHHNALYPLSAIPTSTWDKGDVKDNRTQTVNTHLLGTSFQQGLRASSTSPLNLILDTPYLIYEEHNKSLYEAVRAGPKGGTMVQAAEWFCKLNIPPRAHIVSSRGQRMSVLGAMIAFDRPTAFNYLRQQAEKQLSDQQHLCYMVLQQKPRAAKFIELAKSYLEMRGNSLTPQEVIYIVHLDKSPNFFSAIVEAACEIFEPNTEEWNIFMFFNECYLIHIICGDSSEEFDPKIWASCAAKLSFACPKLTIREVNMVLPTWRDPLTGEPAQGATNSSPATEENVSPPKYSSLQLHFTSDRTYPIEAIDQAERWLSILSYAGRDLNRYLDQELQSAQELPFSDPMFQKPDNWNDLHPRGKLQAIFDCLRPGKRLAPEDGTTDNLLELMPAFRYWHKQKQKPRSGVWIYDWNKRNWVKTADQEKRIPEREWSNNCEAPDWKDLKANSDFALNSWPMCWDITTSPIITNRVKHMGEGYARYREIVDLRFERRQSRKMKSTGKERRVKGGKAVLSWDRYRTLGGRDL